MNPDGYFEVTWLKRINLTGKPEDEEVVERHTLIKSDVNLGLENVLAKFHDLCKDCEMVIRVEVSQIDEVI